MRYGSIEAKRSIVVMVSPLLALMQDQVATYSAKGLSVNSITLEITPEERNRVREGKYQLLFISLNTSQASLISERHRLCINIQRSQLDILVHTMLPKKSKPIDYDLCCKRIVESKEEALQCDLWFHPLLCRRFRILLRRAFQQPRAICVLRLLPALTASCNKTTTVRSSPPEGRNHQAI